MSKIYSKAIKNHLEVSRIIGRIEGSQPGPCLVFIGGIHGNEPSGVFALHQVLEDLKHKATQIKGTVVALAGNLWALERGERFHEADLNRLWNKETISKIDNGTFNPANNDQKEQAEIYGIIQNLISTQSGPFYFFDLHTTSRHTKPFLTVNDSLLNRSFTKQYPAPIILGIEEYLDGPILSYINELGYISFGFESGQHDEVSSISNHVAFTYLSLVFSGAVAKGDIDFEQYFQALGTTTGNMYEIYHRHEIKSSELFEMKPGFANFQNLSKGELLAKCNGQPIIADHDSQIFMPLYQPKGNDGFFLVRKIPLVYLRVSALFRKLKIDRILPLLPGVSRSTKNKDTLLVNLKIARLFPRQFLHLLGYLSKKKDKTHLIIRNREANSKTDNYKGQFWTYRD